MRMPNRLRLWMLDRVDKLRDRLELPGETIVRDRARANRELAEELIERMNAMAEDWPGRHALAWLIEARVDVLPELALRPEIPTIQGPEGYPQLGFLEMLNALIGTIGGDGARADWGLISAVRGDGELMPLVGFELTDEDESIPAEEYPYWMPSLGEEPEP